VQQTKCTGIRWHISKRERTVRDCIKQAPAEQMENRRSTPGSGSGYFFFLRVQIKFWVRPSLLWHRSSTIIRWEGARRLKWLQSIIEAMPKLLYGLVSKFLINSVWIRNTQSEVLRCVHYDSSNLTAGWTHGVQHVFIAGSLSAEHNVQVRSINTDRQLNTWIACSSSPQRNARTYGSHRILFLFSRINNRRCMSN